MQQDADQFLYPAVYTDARGAEETVIVNDGFTLGVRLRGVDFAGQDFDSYEPSPHATPEQLGRFSLNAGSLCSCRIECDIPVPVGGRIETVGQLRVDLLLGDSAPNGGIDRGEVRLVLRFDGREFSSPGTSGWFEDEMPALQGTLPDGVFMRACVNCLHSDYSPGGHGLFGGMMCFRNIKAEYLKVRSKADFWSVHNRFDRWVQETYLCPEFERRVPGTGYRG